MRKKNTTSSPPERDKLRDELFERYGRSVQKKRWLYYRKKYSWLIVIGLAKLLKRCIDIAVSGALLLILSPLLLFIACAIKFYDRGPIFYVANRVGKWGCIFRFPKFRTMQVNAEQQKSTLTSDVDPHGKVTFKMRQDPRITPIGKLLRKTSLDEVPQLWCVLRGDMSLVGPRPPLPGEVALYSMQQRARLDITPGLTCIWQVSGRSNIPFLRQVELDRQYIESQSFWLDLKLLWQTIPAVLTGRGAY